MRMIDADALMECYNGLEKYHVPVGVVKANINDMPTVDAVEVVRCKDCKWFAEGKWCRNPNNDMVQGGTTGEWFCADGEHKGGDE